MIYLKLYHRTPVGSRKRPLKFSPRSMDNPAQTTYNKGCANTDLGGRLGRDDTKNHPEIWKGD